MIMKRDNLKKNLIFQGVGGVIARIGSLIFTIILARLLIPSDFGLYNLALTIIISLTAVIDFGLSTTAVKFIVSSKTKKLARSRFLFLFKLKFMWSLVISILVLILSKYISNFYSNPLLEIPLKVGAIYLFLYSLYNLLGAIFLALEKLKYNTYMEVIFQTFRLLLIIFFLRVGGEISLIFLFLAISVGISILFGAWAIITKFKFLIKGPTIPVERRKMLKFSGFITLGTLGVMIFSNIDKLYLGYFVDLQFIGYYAVIISLLGGAIGTFSIMGIFFPRFISTKEKFLEEKFRKTIEFISLVTIPATFGFAYISIHVVRLLYGDAYVPYDQYLPLLLTSIVLSLLIFEGIINELFKMLLNSRNLAKVTGIGMLLAAVLNMVLNPLLIIYFLRFGEGYALLGVALATVISRYINFGSMVYSVKHKLKITLKYDEFIKPIFCSILMIIFLAILRPYFYSWRLLILILMGAGFYILTMQLLRGINWKEFKKFISE